MKQEFKGFLNIFSFTFHQHVKSKGYRLSSIGIALLCLVLPVGIMTFMGWPQDEVEMEIPEEGIVSEEFADYDYEDAFFFAEADHTSIRNIYVVDKIGNSMEATETGVEKENVEGWYETLNQAGNTVFSALSYKAYADVESASSDAKGSSDTLLLVVDEADYGQELQVLLPEDSSLTEEDANLYESFLYESYVLVQAARAGLSAEALAEIYRGIDMQVVVDESADMTDLADNADGEWIMESEEETEAAEMESIKEILSMVLPYVTIMVLYFMILAYGQGVANSVMMEKNSKLMDTFLVVVKPGAMMLGKVLAIACSGVLQLFLWIFCLVGSFAAGTAIVNHINPKNDLLLIQLFETFGKLSSGLFSISGILLTLLILIGGFLLYCALAAVGGAMASKPEDLSSTNLLFTMALVISFLCALSGGALMGELEATSWMLYMPFTAIMVVPGMALLGNLSTLQCLISLAMILLTTLLITWLAGRIYKLLIFHKGDPLSVQKVLKMLLKTKQEKQGSNG